MRSPTACTLAYNVFVIASTGSSTINSGLFGSSLILSLSTNVITTLMITYKLWYEAQESVIVHTSMPSTSETPSSR